VNTDKSSYVQRLIVTCGVGIGFAVTFIMFGLDVFHSIPDFLEGLAVLVGFALVMILLKLAFRWIDISDVIAGVQMGVVVRCWVPIFTLPWTLSFFDALEGAAVYFAFGLVILFIGYYISKKRKKK